MGAAPLQNCHRVFHRGIATDLTSTILRAVWCSNLYQSCFGGQTFVFVVIHGTGVYLAEED